MGRAHALSPHDRMILLSGCTCILYDVTTGEVRQTDLVVALVNVQPADDKCEPLRIDVKEMSNDPSIPALIEEFKMEEA